MKKLTPRQINAQRRKDGKPPLNFRLLRRIIRKLETTPEAYKQNIWGESSPTAPCGTAACLAGWAAHLDGKLTHQQLRRNPKSAERKAALSIGLSDYEHRMFSGDPWGEWVSPFGKHYEKARTAKARARVAVRYLNHVINTGQIVTERE